MCVCSVLFYACLFGHNNKISSTRCWFVVLIRPFSLVWFCFGATNLKREQFSDFFFFFLWLRKCQRNKPTSTENITLIEYSKRATRYSHDARSRIQTHSIVFVCVCVHPMKCWPLRFYFSSNNNEILHWQKKWMVCDLWCLHSHHYSKPIAVNSDIISRKSFLFSSHNFFSRLKKLLFFWLNQ